MIIGNKKSIYQPLNALEKDMKMDADEKQENQVKAYDEIEQLCEWLRSYEGYMAVYDSPEAVKKLRREFAELIGIVEDKE